MNSKIIEIKEGETYHVKRAAYYSEILDIHYNSNFEIIKLEIIENPQSQETSDWGNIAGADDYWEK